MLKIVDRTSPRIVLGKTAEEHIVIEPPISKAEEYKKIAEAILAKKKKPTPPISKTSIPTPKAQEVIPPKPEKSLNEVAEAIKKRRNERSTLSPTLNKPTKNVFHCLKKNGEELEVVPTIHAIEQFKWRYWIINPKFNPTDDAQLYSMMMKVFNSGRRISDTSYMYRNMRRRDSASAMVWGTKKICFLIDTTTNTIITCELNGDYRKFNTSNFKNMVKNGTFDHSKTSLTEE
jgi:hypothetical protein